MRNMTPATSNMPGGQKNLGSRGLIALITFLSAFIPLSTDLYLPALPHMAKNFNTSASLVNLTLISFFIFFAAGTLFWGPLSDKYGRRPILLSGLVLYTAASILCANAGDVYQLIIFRILQATGSGAATAISTAIVKDVYEGRKRESVLALVQSMGMISPIIAPNIGALILSFTSWRGVFWALSIVGLLAIAGTIALEETIVKRSAGGILHALSRLGAIAGNRKFRSLLINFSLMAVPSMAFVSASSYIYIDGFGLGEQQYSLYFGANALFLVLGPLLYMQVSRFAKRTSIITASYLVSIISGLLIFSIGSSAPWVFALALFPATMAGSIIRPPITNMQLEQVHENIGSASSLMSCTFTLFSSFGMLIISFNWASRVMAMGLLYMIFAALSLTLWLLKTRKLVTQEPLSTDDKVA